MECRVEHIYYGKCPQCGKEQKGTNTSLIDVICTSCDYKNYKNKMIDELEKTNILMDIDINTQNDINNVGKYSFSLYRNNIVVTGLTGCKYRISAIPESDYDSSLHIDILGCENE